MAKRVPVLMTFSTLRSAAGEPLGLVAACEDLSTMRRMEARMRQADRLASLGRMSANIAHEIRNPLASMTGAIEALTARPGIGHDERDQLTEIVMRESDRLNGIINDFLAYARPAPARPRSGIDVAGVLEEVLDAARAPPAARGRQGRAHVRDAAARRDVDANALRQALWNLCLNAVDAMPDGGELTVGASLDGTTLSICGRRHGRGHRRRATSAHIFEPFFSTKPEGSGLGLALVHRDRPRPRRRRRRAQRPRRRHHVHADASGDRPMPDTRVLVVDDERSMRELLAITLRQAGYDVTLADGGDAAIERCATDRFDLVVTDLRMRDTDGMAVLRAVARARARTPSWSS